MPDRLVEPAGRGQNPAEGTRLSFAHLEGAHNSFFQKGHYKSYFQDPAIEEALLAKYAQGADRDTSLHNFEVITSYMGQVRNNARKHSRFIQKAQPGLSSWTAIDQGTGRLVNRNPEKSVVDAMRFVAKVNARAVPQFDNGSFWASWLGRGLRGFAQGTMDIGVAGFNPYRELFKAMGIQNWFEDRDSNFDDFYMRLQHASEVDHRDGKVIAAEIGRMIPLILLTRYLPGSGSTSGFLGKSLGSGVGKPISHLGQALVKGGYAKKLIAAGLPLGLASGLMSPMSMGVDPEDMQTKMGYNMPDGAFEPLSRASMLGQQATSAAVGGVSGVVAAVAHRGAETLLGKTIGWMGSRTGKTPSHLAGTQMAKAILGWQAESLAFAGVGSIHEYRTSSQVNFMKHWAANSSLFGLMKLSGGLWRGTGIGSGKVAEVGGEITMTPRTGLKKWWYNRQVDAAKAPLHYKEIGYSDRIGMLTNVLKGAKDVRGPKGEKRGANIETLVREYKEQGIWSPLGKEFTDRGLDPMFSPMDLMIAKSYAEKNISYHGPHARLLLSKPSVAREALIAGKGHSQFLEGSDLAAKAQAKMREGLREQGIETEAPGTFFDLFDTAKLPKVEKLDADAVEMRHRADFGETHESKAPEARAQNEAIEVGQANRIENIRALERLKQTLEDMDLGDTIAVNPRVHQTIEVLQGVADNARVRADRAVNKANRAVQKLRVEGSKLGKAINARMEKEGMERAGGQLNDVTVLIEETAKMLKDLPKNSKGLVVGGWKGTGPAWDTISAYSRYLFHRGVFSFTNWRKNIIQKTGAEVSDKMWESAYRQSLAQWEKRVVKFSSKMRPMRSLMELVRVGKESANWYSEFEAVFRRVFSENGQPTMVSWQNSKGETINQSFYDLFTSVLSATSSNRTLGANVTLAVNAVTEILQHGSKANFTRRKSYETVKTDDGIKIVDKNTGEILKNQPMEGSKQRVTNWPNEATAKKRIRQLEAVSKARNETMFQSDQKSILKWLTETGEIPLRTPKDLEAAHVGDLGTDQKTVVRWRKRHNFAKNLQGDPDAVTMDTWGMRAMGWYYKHKNGKPIMEKNPTTGRKEPKNREVAEWMYNQFEVTVREIGKQLNMSPREVQAAVWAATRAEWLSKGWITLKGETNSTYEPYIIYKLVSKGNFRRWAGVDMKRLSETHPEVIQALVKNHIPPRILDSHISVKPKTESILKQFLKACFRK